MRRLIAISMSAALVGGLALLVPAGAAASVGETLFVDDFSAGDGAWTTDGGAWAVTAAATYEQSVDAGNARAFAGDPGWADVRVEADVTPSDATGTLTAVLGRVQSVDTYYYLTLRQSGSLEINRLVEGSRIEVAAVPFEIEVGEKYRVGLHMFGDELTGYVDGEPLVQGTDPDGFTAGRIGLKTFNATAEFDNVVVRTATGPGDEPADPGNGEPQPPGDTVVQPGDVPAQALQIGRLVLPAGDGWGSAGPGTTGGAAAEATQVHIARSRADLIEALGGNNATNRFNATPKIVFVEGAISGFEDADGRLLTCDDWADPEYDFEDYLATYDPDVWGWDEDPHGPLEDARVRSRRNQQAHMEINIGPNTTLIGLPGATLRDLSVMVDGADNVIVRNITFEDAADCFPRWRPTDGEFGNWNSEYDNMSIRRSANVWIDNNTFSHSPDDLPEFLGRKFEVWDGLLDITHTSDWVTVSENVFKDSDKMMLIGSTDNPGGGDPGRLNVTLRHNVFDGIGQRAPRIRFGQVDVYNNLYKVAVNALSYEFDYLWGAGFQSQGYFENNYFDLRGSGVDPAQVIRNWGGTQLTEIGTWARTGNGIGQPVSLLDAYHAAGNPPLSDVDWTPELRRGPVLPAPAVPEYVGARAGAGKLADLGGDVAPPPSEPDPGDPPDDESAWRSVDIDNPPSLAAGTTTFSEDGDVVTITGHGKFESGNQVFRFVYVDVEGDFTFTARLDDVDFGGLTSNQARVGLLFTPDSTATGTDFRYAGAMVVGDGTYRRTDRLATGGSAATTTVNPSGDGEVYLRLTRNGDQHQAAFSLDGGETYTTAAVRTFAEPLPDVLHVGFAVNSSSDTVSASATFSDIQIVLTQ